MASRCSCSVSSSQGLGLDATPPTSIPSPEKNLPQALVYQIEEWLQQKGGNLPCTFMGRRTRVNYNLRSKPAVFWMHKSGSKLSAACFKLEAIVPGLYGTIRFIVVQGISIGPHIVSHQPGNINVSQLLNTDHAWGSGYRIWHGISGDAQGYEKEPSVFKINSTVLARCVPSDEVAGIVSTGANTTAIAFEDSPKHLPEAPQVKLEEWYRKNGRQLPPCGSKCVTNDAIQKHGDGQRAVWKHRTGEILSVQRCSLPGFENLSKISRKYVLVARGATFGSQIIPFVSPAILSSSLDAPYKIWLGIDGDETGFEWNKASVLNSFSLKVSMSPYPSTSREPERSNDGRDSEEVREVSGLEAMMEDEYQKTDGVRKRKRDRILADISSYSISAQRLHVDPSSKKPGLVTDIESLEARLAIAEDAQAAQGLTNFQPPAARNGPSTEVEPVSRVDAYLPHEPSEILRSSRSLTAARRSKSRQLTGSPLGLNQPADKSNLEAHILTNTVLLFYDANGKIARSRQFKDCKTSAKLFGQARAANIFQDSEYKAIALKILGEDQTIYLAESDEQDWEDFYEALKAADCWEVGENGQHEEAARSNWVRRSDGGRHDQGVGDEVLSNGIAYSDRQANTRLATDAALEEALRQHEFTKGAPGRILWT